MGIKNDNIFGSLCRTNTLFPIGVCPTKGLFGQLLVLDHADASEGCTSSVLFSDRVPQSVLVTTSEGDMQLPYIWVLASLGTHLGQNSKVLVLGLGGLLADQIIAQGHVVDAVEFDLTSKNEGEVDLAQYYVDRTKLDPTSAPVVTDEAPDLEKRQLTAAMNWRRTAMGGSVKRFSGFGMPVFQ